MKARYFKTPRSFRTWLEKNHEKKRELLVGFYKKGAGKPSITWPESVDEALCFGWIDGVRKSVSAIAYTIRFTPRRPTSIWSAINVARVKALKKERKMMPAGLRAFDARTPERTGVYSFERNKAAKLARHELAEVRRNKKAHAYFETQPPWYRRSAVHWVISAKREPTRERRLQQLISHSAKHRWIPLLRRRPGK